MKKNWLLLIIGFCALLLPIFFRTFWYYQGFPETKKIETPDYSNIKIPVLVTSTPQDYEKSDSSSNAIILFDLAHSNWFTPGEIEPFLTRIQNAGAQIRWSNYENDLLEELNKASAYFVINPTTSFYESELSAVASFVQQGGKLIVITDPTRNEYYSSDYYSTALTSVDVANQILLPYDISFNDDYAYNLLENEGNFRNIFVQTVSDSPLVDEINTLVFYSAHTINSDNGSILTSSDGTLSSISDTGGNLSFATMDDQYNVLAIGDFTFLTSSSFTIADNQLFLSNLSDFAAQNEKLYTAFQFPSMLQGDLAIYSDPELEIDSELLSAISLLQTNSLNATSKLFFVEDKNVAGDRLILSFLPPSEEILALIEPFEIEFSTNEESEFLPTEIPINENDTFESTPTAYFEDDYAFYDWNYSEESLKIPGIGKVSKSGIGLILLLQSGDQFSFVILGNSKSELIQLLNILTYKDFSSCLENSGIVVCPVYTDQEY